MVSFPVHAFLIYIYHVNNRTKKDILYTMKIFDKIGLKQEKWIAYCVQKLRIKTLYYCTIWGSNSAQLSEKSTIQKLTQTSQTISIATLLNLKLLWIMDFFGNQICINSTIVASLLKLSIIPSRFMKQFENLFFFAEI
ncbi:hypothetical protein BpHYR1_039223 [Brachionus plicatilis]|uniref:Uncharacterized protein n=1 Tax=Brachionus plicatilis TaxID=10195 RepID=A0A3M7P8U7_BRAPC|nr:hypothetical protein BpHYR1_039223 [Brachionus plicatilis]